MQAYAELETDTPGTVFGVTQKSDGKWGQRASSSKSEKTQGAEHGSKEHDSHDNTDEENRAKYADNQQLWRMVGFGIVFVIVMYLAQRRPSHSDNWISNEFAHNRGLQSDGENRERYKDA